MPVFHSTVARPSSGSVRHLPSGQWRARVSHRGRQLTIGSFVTRQEALDALAQARGDAARGILGRSGPCPRRRGGSRAVVAKRG